MFKYVMLSACLVTSYVSGADSEVNLQYTFPKEVGPWKIAKELDGAEGNAGKTVIYIPENATEATGEYFGLQQNEMPMGEVSEANLRFGFQSLFPELEANVHIIETDPKFDHVNPKSFLYEWNLRKDGVEISHAWSRVFAIPTGTITLVYQTENIKDIEKTSEMWLKTLRDARIIKDY